MALALLPLLSLWWELVSGYYCRGGGVHFTQAARKAGTGSITCPASGWELAEQGFELGQPGHRPCALWEKKMKSPRPRNKGVLGRLGVQGAWVGMVGESSRNKVRWTKSLKHPAVSGGGRWQLLLGQ